MLFVLTGDRKEEAIDLAVRLSSCQIVYHRKSIGDLIQFLRNAQHLATGNLHWTVLEISDAAELARLRDAFPYLCHIHFLSESASDLAAKADYLIAKELY